MDPKKEKNAEKERLQTNGKMLIIVMFVRLSAWNISIPIRGFG
jgi:hypothetical protein